MKKVTLNYSQALNFIDISKMPSFKEKAAICHKKLHIKDSDYLGWVDLPGNYDKSEFDKIKYTAEKIKSQADVLIVVGIGGSYLGARAAIEMLSHNFYNEIPKEIRKGPKIYFAGHNISGAYIKHLLEVIGEQDVCINVISKSGSTTEPAIVFRLLKDYMECRYGKHEASKRIYATTDKYTGALREIADKEGYESFTIPENIGGRYSILTPVGLLPMAIAGINVDEVMAGANSAMSDLSNAELKNNDAYRYAVMRNMLYSKGKIMEVLVSYEPSLFYFGEWYKQLFGESEGKDGKGIFPTTLSFPKDLHSMGQYVQDGIRNIFETVLSVEKSRDNISITKSKENIDGLNYLSGKTLDYINKKSMEGAMLAHIDGDVPNLKINIPDISPYYLGYLMYFFQKACGLSGYLLEVNPFNQPSVEIYKKNMSILLGKYNYNNLFDEIAYSKY